MGLKVVTACSTKSKYLSPNSPSYTDQSMSRVGEEGCISCRTAPSISKSVLCQTCYDDALSRAPALIHVPDDHKNYKSGASMTFNRLTIGTYRNPVEKQFKHTWRHKTTCPEVKAVYKIVVSDASMTQYQQYLYEWFPVVLSSF